jgi:hypothetical protein
MENRTGLPPVSIPETENLLAASAETIHRHTALLCLENDWIYSGVFAECFGCKGILTAGHCAATFLEAGTVALLISEAYHRLWLKSASFEHVPVGFDETEGPLLSGPDLSFVIIKDENILRAIQSQRLEFYNLDNRRDEAEAIFSRPIAKSNWCVTGCPKEKMEISSGLIGGQPQKVINTFAFAIQCNLIGIEMGTAGYDYIRLRVLSDFENFPDSYKGVSGGGIWYQRFVTNDDKNYRVEPILAGINCWQSQQTMKAKYKVRVVTGHAFVSIYRQVKLALMRKILTSQSQLGSSI